MEDDKETDECNYGCTKFLHTYRVGLVDTTPCLNKEDEEVMFSTTRAPVLAAAIRNFSRKGWHAACTVDSKKLERGNVMVDAWLFLFSGVRECRMVMFQLSGFLALSCAKVALGRWP